MMETNEILEGNRIISVFMGKGKLIDGEYYHDDRRPLMEYHSSWDWLMPVAEKCVCEITDADEESQLFANIHDGLWEFSINKTWIAVVEFIKWYNEQKK